MLLRGRLGGERPQPRPRYSPPQLHESAPFASGNWGAQGGPAHPHSLILGAFHLPCFRCGPQASKITKLLPQASARGGGVADSTPPPPQTLSSPAPHPPGGNSGQAPASSAPACREGIGRRRKVGGSWIWAHPHPSPSSSRSASPASPPSWASSPIPLQPRLPGKPGTGESTGLGLPGVQPLPQGGTSLGGGLCLLCGGGGWSWDEPP